MAAITHPAKIQPKSLPGDGLRRRLLRWAGGMARPSDGAPRHRLVIYEAQRLGDLLLAHRAIAALLAHFGTARSALVITPETRPLADELFPDIAKVAVPLSLPLGGWSLGTAWRLRNELAAHSCDHLVCLRHHRSPLATALLRWIPAHERWGTTRHPWMPPTAQGDEAGLFGHAATYPYPPGAEGVPAEVQAHAELLSLPRAGPWRHLACCPPSTRPGLRPGRGGGRR